MTQHWQELVPADQYIVGCDGLLHEYDRKVLIFLYQPLIGPICISLYMTLWAELEENRLWSTPSTHHSLMSFLDMNLKDIYHARLRLEGMGLLKTHVKNDEEDARSFIYELQPPLTPEQFFQDGLLNIYLYRKVGKNQFARLKRFFTDKVVSSQDGYTEVTRAFQDVFSSVPPKALLFHSDENHGYDPGEGQRFIGRQGAQEIQIDPSTFDFDLLSAGLKGNLISNEALAAPQVKEAISNLSFLYGIDAIQMKNIVLDALTAESEINIEELRKAARDWYQLEHQDQLPELIDTIQPKKYQQAASKPETVEDQLISYLETVSPRQFLIDLSGGAIPSKADLQMIEDIMFNQKLKPGVMNVLLEYVMIKSDKKLNKNFIEKIASHWARKQVKTVKEAMNLAKQEHQKYLEWSEEKKARTTTKGKKPIRKEVLPDWFENSQNPKTAVSDNKGESNQGIDFEEEKKLLEAELREFRSGK